MQYIVSRSRRPFYFGVILDFCVIIKLSLLNNLYLIEVKKMLKQASSIINLPIISLDTGRKAGQVYDFIVDQETGKILACIVQKAGLFRKIKILATEDISNLGPDAVIIEKADLVTLPEEVVRAKQALDSKIKIIKNRVITESGTYLGIAEDFVFDITSWMLVKLYVRTSVFQDLFKGQLIVPYEKICSIGKNAIVVSDEAIKEKVKEMKTVRAT
jgi:uncharacterized protein YrrD